MLDRFKFSMPSFSTSVAFVLVWGLLISWCFGWVKPVGFLHGISVACSILLASSLVDSVKDYKRGKRNRYPFLIKRGVFRFILAVVGVIACLILWYRFDPYFALVAVLLTIVTELNRATRFI